MLDRNPVAFFATLLALLLSSCGRASFATTPTAVPMPIATTTPTGTPTPPNEVFLSEIVKTPQPAPWATSLPNDRGITPGLTTEAEVRARFGDPTSGTPIGLRGLGCIINNQLLWDTDCQVPGDFRKIFAYGDRNVYLQVEGGRVVSVHFGIALKNMPVTTVQTIIDKMGTPELVIFTIPEKRSWPIPASPDGQLVYASKGVEFLFDCQKGSGQLCDGIPRDGLVVAETHFVPLSVTAWFEQEKTNPPFYSDRGKEFYIRPWAGFIH